MLPDFGYWRAYADVCSVIDLEELSIALSILMIGWIGCQGAARWSSGTVDLAPKVSVPRASLRASEESESYISASVEAMVVVRCVYREYGRKA